MASYSPAKRETAWIGYISLVSQADTKLLKSNPTIAAGDFKVSKDGGALANLTTILVTAQIKSHGTAAVAAYGISARLEFLMIPLAFGVGSALTALGGRASGSGDWHTAGRTAWTGRRDVLGVRHQPVDVDGPGLANAVRTVGGLRLHCGVPPRVQQEHMVRGGEVETGATGLE